MKTTEVLISSLKLLLFTARVHNIRVLLFTVYDASLFWYIHRSYCISATMLCIVVFNHVVIPDDTRELLHHSADANPKIIPSADKTGMSCLFH